MFRQLPDILHVSLHDISGNWQNNSVAYNSHCHIRHPIKHGHKIWEEYILLFAMKDTRIIKMFSIKLQMRHRWAPASLLLHSQHRTVEANLSHYTERYLFTNYDTHTQTLKTQSGYGQSYCQCIHVVNLIPNTSAHIHKHIVIFCFASSTYLRGKKHINIIPTFKCNVHLTIAQPFQFVIKKPVQLKMLTWWVFLIQFLSRSHAKNTDC